MCRAFMAGVLETDYCIVSIEHYSLLAVHEFRWWRGDRVLHFASDGEIAPGIVALLMRRSAEPVEDQAISSDDLLTQQKGNL